MQREIGSNFDLKPTSNNGGYDSLMNVEVFDVKGSDSVFLSSGRQAESIVLDTIIERNPHIRKVALIPSFTCNTVLEPFLRHGYQIISYPIDNSLHIKLDDFIEILNKSEAQVVLLHSYFGFDTLKGLDKVVEDFSSKGVVFVEDRTQCLYSSFDSLSVDYIIGSMRKWAGLPDGGFAVCKVGVFNNKPHDFNEELECLKLEASYAKYNYLNNISGDKQYFLDLFYKAEHQFDLVDSYFKISPSSVFIQQKMDISILIKKRRENYQVLYEGLKSHNTIQILMPNLTEVEVPLYFTILLKNRDSLQKYLRLHDIYAPVVWPKAEVCPNICDEAQHIYDNILCLPVDQRYDSEDMERILDVLKEY